MRLLFVADVMGSPGRLALKTLLPRLRERTGAELLIVNGENAAGGSGITPKIAGEFFDLGVDLITGGNHSWDNRDGVAHLDREPRLLRPHNYPEGNPGSGLGRVPLPGGGELTVLNLQGRIFMAPLPCPFRAADTALDGVTGPVLVDFHAEVSSEKIALARYLDGRVSAVIGTHTHVQTADARLLPGGTAFLTDAGMTGPHDGVIGMTYESTLPRFLRLTPSRFQVAKGEVRLQGAVLDFDAESGRAAAIETFDLPLEEDA